MFCVNCGSPLKDGQKFCENCGTPVPQAKAEPQQAQWQGGAAVQEAPAPEVQQAPSPIQEPWPEAPHAPQAPTVTFVQPTQQAPGSASGMDGKRARSVLNCGVKLAITRFFQNYAEFNGRASRSEYWWAFLMNWAIAIVAGWLGKVVSVIPALAALALLVPGLAVFVRREHDIGRRWTRIFVGLIPLVGVILLLIDMLKPSEGANRFGPAPIDASQLTN